MVIRWYQLLTNSDLVGVDRKVWDINLIQDLVGHENDASGNISHTPLIESIQEDKIIWKYEKNGHYLVKSVYRFFIDETMDTSPFQVDENWNLIRHAKS